MPVDPAGTVMGLTPEMFGARMADNKLPARERVIASIERAKLDEAAATVKAPTSADAWKEKARAQMQDPARRALMRNLLEEMDAGTASILESLDDTRTLDELLGDEAA